MNSANTNGLKDMIFFILPISVICLFGFQIYDIGVTNAWLKFFVGWIFIWLMTNMISEGFRKLKPYKYQILWVITSGLYWIYIGYNIQSWGDYLWILYWFLVNLTIGKIILPLFYKFLLRNIRKEEI